MEALPIGHGRRLLEVKDLQRSFGGVQAVDGASFSVETGTVTGLIGPNGAGKSTVVALISGAVKSTGGEIWFEGERIGSIASHKVARHGIIRTFQLSSQFSRLTVFENVLVAAPNQPGESLTGALRGGRHWRAREAELLDKASDLLDRFSLTDKCNDYAGSLSGGQRRLLELARALMAEPKLLLLDEPMVGVSPPLARTITDHLGQLRTEGMTMLVVEHDLDMIERLCDKVVVMADGRVIATGTMSELRAQQEVVDAYIGS